MKRDSKCSPGRFFPSAANLVERDGRRKADPPAHGAIPARVSCAAEKYKNKKPSELTL